MSRPPSTAYERLAARFSKIAIIQEASAFLQADAVTFMPKGGAVARGEQQAVLKGLVREFLIEPGLADDLAAAGQDSAILDDWQSANLRLMQKDYVHARAVPADLLDAQERAEAACEMAWRDAKKSGSFASILPHLTDVIKLDREEAAALSAATGLSPRDAMIGKWQPDVASADIDPVFAEYRHFLKDALPRAEEIQARQPPPIRPGHIFPAARQAIFCRKLSAAAGLDYDHARLDESMHPQSGGAFQDNRLTTRYDERDPLRGLMAVMHETGHALYEQGLPFAHARQPVGRAVGMAMHESQSLFIEVQVCRSNAYLSWLGPKLSEFYGGDPALFAPENLARLCRRVERGFVRVGADPLTYPAHIILRYDMEKAILSGDLKPADIPGAWREGMQNLLGIVPPDDGLGCLQDIHWYVGLLGYFPSYTLGAMAAAQFMEAARAALPGLETDLARGDLSALLAWQRKHIHGRGSLLGFNDLLREVTGKPLDPKCYEKYLASLYLSGP